MSEAFLSALHADPWNNRLLDLPSLNAQASDAVETAVAGLSEMARRDPTQLRSMSQVFLGPPGVGKTHLFSRLRKRLGPRAVFVHIRPLLHAGLTPAFVLNEAVMQLAQASYGHSQADALVGSLVAHTGQASTSFPMVHLMDLKELPDDDRATKLDEALEKVLDIFPDLDDVYTERLLRLPFCSNRERRAMLAWLAGHDCDPSQLQRIGAASSLGSEHAVRALRTLGCVASLGSPLVLVFDQLENLIHRNREEERITQYGNLIAELVDATRGLLIVQMALDSEWEQGIEARLNLSQRSRVVMSKKSIVLPTPQESRQLLQIWHEEIESPDGPLPWPFRPAEFEALLTLPGLTPRMLLCALGEAREGVPIGLLKESLQTGSSTEEPQLDDLEDVLQKEWSARLASTHASLDEVEERRGAMESSRLCDAVLTAAVFAPSLSLLASSNEHIQIDGNGDPVGWVSLLHQSHHRSVNAVLDRILQKKAIERGFVLREQWRPFPPTWKSSLKKQDEVLARGGTTWFELTREDVALLLTLEDFIQASRSSDICDSIGRPVPNEAVQKFIKEQIRPDSWPLLRELTSKAPVGAERQQEAKKDAHRTPEPIEVNAPASFVEATIHRLRVASVDRVIREVQRVEPAHGRAGVIQSLKALGPRIKWHGRNIVAVEETE